jgi:beta-lactamase regulating signal transducer with metallopeptidase domain
MNRLENIANRQRRSRARDIVFAAFIAMAAVIGMTSVSAACQAASPTHLAHNK